MRLIIHLKSFLTEEQFTYTYLEDKQEIYIFLTTWMLLNIKTLYVLHYVKYSYSSERISNISESLKKFTERCHNVVCWKLLFSSIYIYSAGR